MGQGDNMKSKSRSPYIYGAGGCLLGFMFMVCSMTLLLLGRAVLPPSLLEFVARYFNICSWLVPIAFGVLGYLWGRARKVNQEVSGEDIGGDDHPTDVAD